MSRFARKFQPFYESISEDIFKFCEAMNFEPTWQQRELLELVQRGIKRIAVKSGQGPGKTTCSVIVGLWRTFREQNSMTVVTAPTMRQCTTVWITEARRLLSKADPMLARWFQITNTKILIGGREMWGIKTVTATNPEAAQGLHEENMTIIAEEASGIPRKLMEQFEGTTSGPNNMFMQIGNPNTNDCGFRDAFTTMRDFWATLTFNAEDTARDYPWLISQENLDMLAYKYGKDSDVYRVRVLGEFPKMDPRCIIDMEDLEACSKTSKIEMAKVTRYINGIWTPAKQFGLDYARYGSDESTLFKRTGHAITDMECFNHTEPQDVIARAFAMQQRAKWRNDACYYVSDATGIGQGLQVNFRNGNKQWLEFHNHGKSPEAAYDNKITHAWYHFANIVKDRNCYLPLDQRLIQQLTTRQYYLTRKGKIIVESKDEYEKRGFDSPDRAEGLIYSFYDDLEAGTQVADKSVEDRRNALREHGHVYDDWQYREEVA